MSETSEASTDSRIIEKGRLRRAWAAVIQERVTQLPTGEYRVIGSGGKRYYVDPNAETPCYCGDSEFRGAKVTCYHALAALLMAHDQEVLIAAGEWRLSRKKSSVLT